MSLLALLALTLPVFAQTPAAPATPAPTPKLPDWAKIEANIPYDQYPANVLDIIQPKQPAKGKRSGVIFIHGGGWIQGTKDSGRDTFVLPYVKRGCVVASVEYRLARDAPAPAAVSDVLKATRWFFDHAEQYQVDPARIVVTGGSAGGHLALMVGMLPESAGFGRVAKIAAIVNCYGITDVADLLDGPNRKGWAAQWVPEQPDRLALGRRLSPLTYVRKDLPPILTIHGDADKTVPYTHGQRLQAALQQAGADAELMTVPKADHAMPADQWPQVHARIFEFLGKRGVLP